MFLLKWPVKSCCCAERRQAVGPSWSSVARMLSAEKEKRKTEAGAPHPSAREEKTHCIPAVGPAAVCFRTEIEGKKNSGGGVVWSSKTPAKLQQTCTVPGDHVVCKATGGHLCPGRGGGA
ncbi:hypothetical protein AOLI_G00056500 [Acnodon oligacanthus]